MIFIIIICIYLIITLYNKKKANILKTFDIAIESQKDLIYSGLILFIFLFVFVFFMRFLRLFNERRTVNLYGFLEKIMLFSKNHNFMLLIITIVILYFLVKTIRKILTQILKLAFIKLNLWILSKSSNYFRFFIKFNTWHDSLWFWFCVDFLKLKKEKTLRLFFFTIKDIIYLILKFTPITILIVCFILDITWNQGNLLFMFYFLPWISVYQLCFNINWYLTRTLDVRNDCNLSDFIYPSKYDFDPLNLELLQKLEQYLEDITKY